MIYGAKWNKKTKVWTRTGAAKDFPDPVAAIGDGDGFSPFDNLYPWCEMKRYADPEAGEVVSIPEYWFRIRQKGDTIHFEVSDEKVKGFHRSPSHKKRGDGFGKRQIIYIGRYKCGLTGKSRSGVIPARYATRAQFREAIHSLGEDIWQNDIALFATLRILYLVEFANWKAQETLGLGCSENNELELTGATDKMKYHTGTSADGRDKWGHVQYRWVEDPFGNLFEWYDGIRFEGEKTFIIMNPAEFSNEEGGVYVGDRPLDWDWIESMKVSDVKGFKWFFQPDELGSDSESVGDYCYYDASGVVLYGGGYYGQYRYYGLFYLSGNYAASHKNANIGSRLQKLPCRG